MGDLSLNSSKSRVPFRSSTDRLSFYGLDLQIDKRPVGSRRSRVVNSSCCRKESSVMWKKKVVGEGKR